MKLKILSVLGVLIAVLMSTAVLTACNKAPAGDELSGGSGESLSTEQGGETSESESGEQSDSGGEGGAQDSEKSHSAAAIEFNDNFPTYGMAPTFTENFAKASFMGYFAPMIVTLSNYGSFDFKNISAEEAFDCFEAFLSESRLRIENYDKITIKYDEYLQYYPAEIVENFVLKCFGITAESMRKLSVFNSEIEAYERLYYSGITKGKTEISAVRLNEPECELDFSCSGFLHSAETISGTATMKYGENGFVLSEIRFD